jgi:hypothetical protein
MRVGLANSVGWIEQIEKTGLMTRLRQLLRSSGDFRSSIRRMVCFVTCIPFSDAAWSSSVN